MNLTDRMAKSRAAFVICLVLSSADATHVHAFGLAPLSAALFSKALLLAKPSSLSVVRCSPNVEMKGLFSFAAAPTLGSHIEVFPDSVSELLHTVRRRSRTKKK